MPTDLVTRITDVAVSTPWLHGPMAAYASLGLAIFAVLVMAGWWLARDRDDRVMATALLARLVGRARATRLKLLLGAPAL